MKIILLIMKDLLKYRNFLAGIVFVLCMGSCKESPSLKTVATESGNALGTTYTIKYEVNSGVKTITPDLKTLFDRVNRSMSTYLPDSDISRINKGDSTVVTDAYFKEVYTKAKAVWQKSNGMFDPTVGALVNAWGFGPGKALREMTQKQVDSILEFTGFDKVSLLDDGRIVKKHKSLYLDFNALAKGYTIDLIGRMLNEKGIKNYLIEVGGEIIAKGINPETMKKWTLAIDDPTQEGGTRTFIARLRLKDKAMATSGNYRKFRIDSITGMRYVHIINPKTGYPQKSNVLSVSVIAATCMEADAYATTFMVMELSKTKELLNKLPGIDAYIIYIDDEDNLIPYTTKGFEALMLD